MEKTFEIVEGSGQQGIKCLVCGMTSYNPTDISEKFCGHCNDYHEFPFLDERKNMNYIKNEKPGKKDLDKIILSSDTSIRSLRRACILDAVKELYNTLELL